MRFGLERMRRLMTVLASPQERFASIHVVGTNGKSSTARMIAAILQHQGIRAGAYLSPHLHSYAERIEIMGRPTSRERFAAAVGKVARAAEIVDRGLSAEDHVTQFEALTAAAYLELDRSGIETAVVEAGLGGRYDATSVIDSSVQVLTNVGLEHTRWLGPTERHIAEEKLAVVPPNGTLVTGPLRSDALEVAERVAAERPAALLRANRDFFVEDDQRESFAVRTSRARYGGIVLRALGGFQKANFALAVAAAEAFIASELDGDAVGAAARELVLPGRLELVARDPLVILDGAHNAAGAEALRSALAPLLEGRTLVAVLSILDDKDAAGMLSTLIPLCSRIVFTRSGHARALPPATLQSLCGQLSGPPSEVVGDPVQAVARACEVAGTEGAVLVSGSIYLLSDLAREGVGAAAEVVER
jgi:dihydrofolate synthase/folylpolyglutamate synthase